MRRVLPWLVLVTACAEEPSGPVLVSATPDHGPLVGGTQLRIRGEGFAKNAPVRVSIGGREAPLAHAIDATTLEVIIPPGERTGDAEIVVIAGARTASAAHLFHYSGPPVVSAVLPAEVDYAARALLTVTGEGFRDEAVGELAVLVDGVAATDVVVVDDRTLTFTAPRGTPFVKPDLEVFDLRGSSKLRAAFRYRPGPHPGLLLFPRTGPAFALFFDPVAHTSVPIPRLPSGSATFTTVYGDEAGEFWAFDRGLRWGRLDLRTQTIVSPVQTNLLFPALVRVGSAVYGIERFSQQFGRFDPGTSEFTPMGAVPCCGSFGLATDGSTLWLVSRPASTVSIATIDLATGTIGTQVPVLVPAGVRIEELRALGGVVYGSTSDQRLVAIDPATGGISVQPVNAGRVNAMEVAR